MRLPIPKRKQRSAEPPDERAADERPSGAGTWWKVLAAVALGAVAYLAWRRSRSGERVPWVDEERADVAGSAPGGREPEEGREVPIDEPTDVDAGGERAGETVSGVDPTLEEVDERVEEGVDEEPMEPGTVTVDEDVAEEAGEVEPDEEEAADVDAEPAEDEDTGVEGGAVAGEPSETDAAEANEEADEE